MRISDRYRDANRELHATNVKYGTSGAKWSRKVAELAAAMSSPTILDYGCGKGLLKAALPALNIVEYDPAIPGKDAEPERADLVVCTDVLEHIEPDCLDDVLGHLKELTIQQAFFNIATRPAVKSLPDGRNAHLIIEPAEWWRPRIEKYFEIIAWEPVRDAAVNCVVRPR
jgi:2-polyprenyl-3-methyl-5-hydroxy-6-metoxy-1,4-benzoquinol methylase